MSLLETNLADVLSRLQLTKDSMRRLMISSDAMSREMILIQFSELEDSIKEYALQQLGLVTK